MKADTYRKLLPLLMWTCVIEVGVILLLAAVSVIHALPEAGWRRLPAGALLAVGCGWFLWLVRETRAIIRLDY